MEDAWEGVGESVRGGHAGCRGARWVKTLMHGPPSASSRICTWLGLGVRGRVRVRVWRLG